MADADASTPSDTPPAPGGLKARLPLLAAVVIGLAVGVGTGAVVVGPGAARSLGYTLPDSLATLVAGAAPVEDAEPEETAEGDSAAKGAPAVLTLENLVLNPAGSGGARFLLLSVAIEGADAAAVTKLQSRDAELRDVVLSTLGLKSVDELAEITAREGIKTQLVAALNERFGKQSVRRVYFPQYVVQ
jgi:flagellar FliL protein